jgi:hypothetical protein
VQVLIQGTPFLVLSRSRPSNTLYRDISALHFPQLLLSMCLCWPFVDMELEKGPKIKKTKVKRSHTMLICPNPTPSRCQVSSILISLFPTNTSQIFSPRSRSLCLPRAFLIDSHVTFLSRVFTIPTTPQSLTSSFPTLLSSHNKVFSSSQPHTSQWA